MSSHKVYSKINESPQIHLEARDVLLDASNNLKNTIKEYKILFMQREETLSENYETLIMKPHRYESKKVSRIGSKCDGTQKKKLYCRRGCEVRMFEYH